MSMLHIEYVHILNIQIYGKSPIKTDTVKANTGKKTLNFNIFNIFAQSLSHKN